MFSRWTVRYVELRRYVVRLYSHGFSGVWPIRFATSRSASAACVRTLVSLGTLFFLNTPRPLEAKARSNYVETEELTIHTSSDTGAAANFRRALWPKPTASGRLPAHSERSALAG